MVNEILKTDIPDDWDIKKLEMCIRDRCNLSQGIKEDGIAIGEARKEEKIILNMHNNGFTVEPVSYTHLDVYKRQGISGAPLFRRGTGFFTFTKPLSFLITHFRRCV